ncbi:MAG: LON peptidase substrate-binding domain-containing protein [Bacteroidota bacterium]
MSELIKIPMFPLSIFPLPGELVPLHIFEPRYKQLLNDAESRDISFGIYFNHIANEEKLGSLVKLESVLKRYPSGESDIIVKCTDLFSMAMLYRTFRDKLYPGGEVSLWNVETSHPLSPLLLQEYTEYRTLLKINNQHNSLGFYDVANELNLSFEERLRFVKLDAEKKETFLLTRLRYQTRLLHEVEKSKDLFHLN